jgi:signal transduction histidine kinase
LRKPERFELVVFGLSLAILVVSALELAAGAQRMATAELTGLAPLLIASGVLILLLQLVAASVAIRQLSLVLHFLYVSTAPFLCLCDNSLVAAALTSTFIYQAALRLKPRTAAMLSVVVILVTTGSVAFRSEEITSTILSGTVLAMLAFASGYSVAVRESLVRASQLASEQQISLDNLETANASFVEHLATVEEESAERERLRITRDLHDSIGYGMTNIGMMMNAAPYLLQTDQEKLQNFCERTRDLAEQTLQEARTTLYKLRSIATRTRAPLQQFFIHLCREFEASTGVTTVCHPGNVPQRVPETVYSILFRAAQVGLINALRHGHCTNIQLYLWSRPGSIEMSIWNNSPGTIELSVTPTEGIGLRGIKERLNAVGGAVEYGPDAGGFQLVIDVPLVEREGNL